MINKLLTEYGMENCQPKDTPMEVGFQTTLPECYQQIEVPYRSLVCSLLYLAVTTRPDIAFPVSNRLK